MSEDNRKLELEIAAGERWLEGIRTPLPSAELLKRTKLAVRSEVAKMQWESSGRRRWFRWTGVAAAAAVLLAGVGLGWYATKTPDSTTIAFDPESPLATWLADANDELTRFASIEDGLADLEEWSANERWTADGASMYDAMNEALRGETDGADEQKGAMAPIPQSLSKSKVSHGIS